MGKIELKIEELASQVALDAAVEVDRVELMGQGRRSLLRIYIDKPGGVTVKDCETFSRDMSAILDVEDLLGSSYTLEVSSPGLDKPLRGQKDFARRRGERARLVLKSGVGGGTVTGLIGEAGPEGVVIEQGHDKIEVKYADISKAGLEIEIR